MSADLVLPLQPAVTAPVLLHPRPLIPCHQGCISACAAGFQIFFNRVTLFLCCRICLHTFLPLCQAVLALEAWKWVSSQLCHEVSKASVLQYGHSIYLLFSNAGKNTDIFCKIRCMKISCKRLIPYACSNHLGSWDPHPGLVLQSRILQLISKPGGIQYSGMRHCLSAWSTA